MDWREQDHYAVLGVSPNADLDIIKRAYRDLAKIYHPDNAGSDPRASGRAHQEMSRLNLARDTLMNRRAEYDRVYRQRQEAQRQDNTAESEAVVGHRAQRMAYMEDLLRRQRRADEGDSQAEYAEYLRWLSQQPIQGRDAVVSVELDREMWSRGCYAYSPVNGAPIWIAAGTQPSTHLYVHQGFPGANGGWPGHLFVFISHLSEAPDISEYLGGAKSQEDPHDSSTSQYFGHVRGILHSVSFIVSGVLQIVLWTLFWVIAALITFVAIGAAWEYFRR